MTITYHEVEPSKLNDILKHGLKRASRGSKGNDKYIIKTDELLDKYRTENLREMNVSRNDNLYSYVVVDDKIIDITTGDLVDATEFIKKSRQAIVKLTVDPSLCFVSDLYAYGQVKVCNKRTPKR